MKKILLTCTDLMAIQFFTEHIKYWHDRGYRVDLVCSPVGERVGELTEFYCGIENGSIRTVALSRSPFKVSNVKGYRQMREIAESEHYDIVVTNEPVMGLITRLAFADRKNTKVIYIAHGFHFYKGGSALGNFVYKTDESFMARYTDAIVTINEEDFKAAEKFTCRNNGRAYQIPGIGVKTSRFYKSSTEDSREIRKELGLAEDDFVVVVIGELNDNKNQETIIRAIASIKDKCPRLVGVFLGKGERAEYLENLCNQLNVSDKIKLLGYRQDVDRILSACDLGASASIREGLGINLIEEMAAGLPVVASDNRGHRDLIGEENGILAQTTSVEEFAEAIQVYYNSPEKCRAASECNLEQCRRYDIEAVKPLLLSIIED